MNDKKPQGDLITGIIILAVLGFFIALFLVIIKGILGLIWACAGWILLAAILYYVWKKLKG